MRRNGKSWAANAAKEAALDAGEKVLVVTRHSTTLQQRKKHLTMIQDVSQFKASSAPVIDDHVK